MGWKGVAVNTEDGDRDQRESGFSGEVEREALQAGLLVRPRLVALDLDQLQLYRPRRVLREDAELRVQVLSEILFGHVRGHRL